MKNLKIVILFLIGFVLIGCAKEDIDVFRFINHEITLHVGEETTLDLIYGEFSEDSKVNFTPSKDGIVEINENDKVVKGTAVGEVTITATIDGIKTAKLIINVIKEPISSLLIISENYVVVNETIDLNTSVYPKHLPNNVTWSLEGPNNYAAEITNGKLKGLVGDQTLAEYQDYGKKVTVVGTSTYDPTIKVKKDIRIQSLKNNTVTLTASKTEFIIGESVQLTPSFTPKSNEAGIIFTNPTVIYTSSNEKIAKVDSNGLVTTPENSKEAGLVTITAKTIEKDFVTTTIDLTVNYPPTESLKVTASKTEFAPKQTSQLKVDLTPFNANPNLTYTSSDETIAEVNNKGLVSTPEGSTKTGTVIITATSVDNVVATIELIIRYEPTTKVEVTAPTNHINLGDSLQLEIKISPQYANPQVTYTSSDETIAIVDENGLVTTPENSTKTGEVTITVTSVDNVVGTIVITVHPNTTSITVTAPTNELTIGETVQLTSTLDPLDANPVLTYTTSDETIAIVDENGLVSTPENSTKTGEVTITVTSADNIVGTITITVKEAND